LIPLIFEIIVLTLTPMQGKFIYVHI
jgi:hypothetical protein